MDTADIERRVIADCLTPKPQELQITHFCCECGKRLEPGTYQMCTTLPLRRGTLQTVQRVAWCEGCWGEQWIEAEQREGRPTPTQAQTGPMRFGDDWRGLYVRGDEAKQYAKALHRLLETGRSGEVAEKALGPLVLLLASVGLPIRDEQRMRPFLACLARGNEASKYPQAPEHLWVLLDQNINMLVEDFMTDEDGAAQKKAMKGVEVPVRYRRDE